MAASIKISELNSLTDLTDVDLFLVSDMETGTSRKISYTNLKSNVITETASALSSLESIVSQNKTDVETLVETIRVALQAAVDNNTSSFGLADTELDTRLDVLEADPATQANVDSQVATLTAAITALQTEVSSLDIDIAPETLNTIDELASALGDDPTFLSTLQARLTAIESDNATQTGLDLKLDAADPVFTGIITGPDIDINN